MSAETGDVGIGREVFNLGEIKVEVPPATGGRAVFGVECACGWSVHGSPAFGLLDLIAEHSDTHTEGGER